MHQYNWTLDCLAEFKDRIEEELFFSVRDIFKLKLDLVFGDTTIYFERQGPERAKEGYSKDHRPNKKQIVNGVFMTFP